MSTNPPPAPVNLDAQAHTASDIDVLFRIYLKKRLEGQLKFYESRVRENELNSDFTFTLGTFIMTLSSLLATISASAFIPELALISAILPAFSALLAAFRQLYGWDRQTGVYRDAVLGLEKIRLLAPDDDRMAFADLAPLFPKLVMSSEAVFTAENGQWGQIVNASEQELARAQASDPLARLIATSDLSPDQKTAIQSIVSSSQAAAASVVTMTDVKVTPTEMSDSSQPTQTVQITTTNQTMVEAELPMSSDALEPPPAETFAPEDTAQPYTPGDVPANGETLPEGAPETADGQQPGAPPTFHG